jgi:hypothetical protein
MSHNPAFQFYPGDWFREPGLQRVDLDVRGAWAELLMMMHHETPRGVSTGSISGLARQLRIDVPRACYIIEQLQTNGIAEVEYEGNSVREYVEIKAKEFRASVTIVVTNYDEKINSDGLVTIINRRMIKEDKDRKNAADRQARMREKGGGDPERWTAIRVEILKRDNRTCGYCGRYATTVDHIFPKSKGGDESDSNLISCCKSCNFKKGNKTLEESGMKLRNSDKKVTSSSPSPTPTPKKNIVGSVDPTVFDLLWKSWVGAKGPKQDAVKVFKEVKPPENVVELLVKQIRYKQACDKKGVFCSPFPHVFRWLKKRRWEDEIPDIPSNGIGKVEKQLKEAYTCKVCGEIHQGILDQPHVCTKPTDLFGGKTPVATTH